MAANEDGLWNETPDRLAFTLAPAFYQTKWFLAFCFLALILTGIILFRLRVRSAADRLRLGFEERLDERLRVAQDLHDNLLQEVMGISLQLEIADELTPPEAAGKPILGRALRLSESALTHGRGALTTLRATALTQQDIYQALSVATAPFSEDCELFNTTSMERNSQCERVLPKRSFRLDEKPCAMRCNILMASFTSTFIMPPASFA
jgi:signal transduction histidine kinase